MSNFHPLEVLGRASETQLQVGENFNHMIQRQRVISDYTKIKGSGSTANMKSGEYKNEINRASSHFCAHTG